MNGYVTIDAAREHLLELRARGLTVREIGELVGILPENLGRVTGGRQRWMRPKTEERILAVPLDIAPRRELEEDRYRMPPELRALAACRGMDPSLFFPEENNTSASVKAVCTRCPIRQECLEEALANDEPGIWGGTSERHRRQIRRDRKKETAA